MSACRLTACLSALVLSGCIIIPIPVSRDTIGDPGPAPATASCPRVSTANTAEKQIIQRINSFRASNALPPVRQNSKLSAAAQAHACDNAARGLYSHDGSDGSTLAHRLKRGGYAYATGVENTGLGFADAPDRMATFWENSPKHRANLLNPKVTEAGLGLAQGGKGPAWVLVMARPR
ncbi:MAG TPA: CAP domain-containing protein [Gemmobacter sp.]|nr:CAP domain-containing protein [Gemmobacter sp.]